MPSFRKLFRTAKADKDSRSAAQSKPDPPAAAPSHRTAGSPAGKAPHAAVKSAPPAAPQVATASVSGSDRPETSTRAQPAVGIAAHAEAALNEALEKRFPTTPNATSASPQFTDLNSLTENVEDVIGQMMDKNKIEENEQALVKAVTNHWVKKAIPYVQKGLSVAEVPPFNFFLCVEY
jgi:hypothetical protein